MLRIIDFFKQRLFLRLQIFIAIIGVLCVFLGIALWSADRLGDQLSARTQRIMRKQTLIEKVNGLVYASVMESRGFYIATNKEQIERFAKSLEAHLANLQATIEEWRTLVVEQEAAQFAAFSEQAAAFVRLRSELIAEGRAKGAEGARAVGDNEASRSVRMAFNQSLEALAAGYRERLAQNLAQNAAKEWQMALLERFVLGAIALLTLIGWHWLARHVARPFNDLSSCLGRMNAGETNFTVAHQNRGDEVGGIARAIEASRAAIIERRQAGEASIAESKARAERQAHVERAIAQFEASAAGRVQVVANTSGDLHQAAATMSTAAEETARQAEIVSEASNEMNANIDTLAGAGNKLVAAIGEIASGMGNASEISDRASRMSRETAEKFTDLAAAVSSIGQVVDLINSIAGQTNLLALNATIEAARAGEAGRGFAVVASEVKQLAAQTTKATADIAANVARVQGVTSESIAAVDLIGSTIEQMRQISSEMAKSVLQQRQATEDIAENVAGAARGTEQVSANITGVSSAAAETGDSAMKVLQSSARLSQEADAIRADVERFLNDIRAA